MRQSVLRTGNSRYEDTNLMTHAGEVAQGDRFEFGKNWARFLQNVDEEQIADAGRSLQNMLEVSTLNGKTFLDIGSGSGLFSLAARRLGARVYSFDYDPNSVACTQELKRRYFPGDTSWTVETGSALDEPYIRSLGLFDVVYSWGVLHHTGRMWTALANASLPVAPGGKLFIAIYNNQGTASRRWTTVKRLYNRTPRPLRFVWLAGSFWVLNWRSLVKDILRFKPFYSIRHYGAGRRGMSFWRDLVDWVGGYPFEVASPEELFNFYRKRGFQLTALLTCGGSLGCNELVFQKEVS